MLDRNTVQLLPGAQVHTDIAQFESAARAALLSGDTAQARDAAASNSGELLPDGSLCALDRGGPARV